MKNARPAALMADNVADRIRTGNFEETSTASARRTRSSRPSSKNSNPRESLMQRVEDTAKEDAIVSTNTSGIPLHSISEGRSQVFKARFVGTHFFEPAALLEAHGDYTYRRY